MDLRSFLSDLKRRHVFRVAAMYAVVAFVVLQAAELLFPALLLPDWAFRLTAILALLGLPIAVALAWAFDITPDGVRRTDPAGSHAASDGAPEPAAPLGPRGFDQRKLAYVGVGILLALVGFGVASPYLHLGRAGAAAGGERSVAVLPFANLSPDEENQYFADGITEDILGAVANIPGLHVISRTTVMGYRGTTKSIREIGAELGVASVLEGSVRREGNRVRITAQLIDAATDEHLWSESYDRELTDILRIQTEIAQQIAAALQARLSPEEESRAERRLEAYYYAVRGREYFGRGGVQHNETAIALFQEALAIDSSSAPARAGLADAYLVRAEWGASYWLDSAAVSAARAVALDEALAEAHAAHGRVQLARGRPAEALASFERALRASPSDAAILASASAAHREAGRLDEALRAARRAAQLDPGDGRRAVQAGDLALQLGRADEGVVWARAAAEAERPSALAHAISGRLALERGDSAAARAAAATLLDESGNDLRALLVAAELELAAGEGVSAAAHFEAAAAALGDADDRAAVPLAHLLQIQGGAEEAATLVGPAIARLTERVRAGDASPEVRYRLARAEAVAGRTPAALARLEEAVRLGFRDHRRARADALLGGLRTDPRFEALLGRMARDLELQARRLDP